MLFSKIKYFLQDYKEKKYSDINKEDSQNIHIWGIKSWDDITPTECGLYTMNDFSLDYNKKKKKFWIGVETVYDFKDKENGAKDYVKSLLEQFTTWMIDNNHNVDEKFEIYEVLSYGMQPINSTQSFTCSSEFDSIEDAYKTFKFYAQGFINQ